MEASISEMLVNIMVQFQIGEFEYNGENPLHPEPVNLSELPLMKKAEEWNLTVKIVRGYNKRQGHYDKDRREILLVSPDTKVWFRELAHAAMERLGDLTMSVSVHETVSGIIAAFERGDIPEAISFAMFPIPNRYIQSYAEKLKLSPQAACLRVMSETEKDLNLILKPKGAVQNVEHAN